MGVKILFFVVVILIAVSLSIYNRIERKKLAKSARPSLDALINSVTARIKEIEEGSTNMMEIAEGELIHCKQELKKLNRLKKQLNIK